MNAATAIKFPNPFVLGTFSNKRAPAHAGDRDEALSYKIRTTEPDWREQRHDPDVKAGWKKDALEESKRKSEREQRCSAHQPMTAGMIDYAFDELEGFRPFRRRGGRQVKACFDAIYESDCLVPDDLRMPRNATSRSQVNDIVDPSWYPLMYGRTLNLQGPRTPRIQVHLEKVPMAPSRLFKSTPRARSKSSRTLTTSIPRAYRAVLVHRSVFAELVPLLDQTLSDLLQSAPPIILAACVSYWYEYDYVPKYSRHDYLGMDKHMRRHAREMAYLERLEHRRFVLPSPSSFKPSSTEKIQARLDNPCFTLKGRTVQVIVKFINYKLTPAQPTYDGGEWRVVGLRTECVVATALYCYDEENQVFLASRKPRRRCSCSIRCDGPGPLLTFPNVYQHRTGRFSLRDKTKPGHRKLVAFFLVDPTQRITSTTTSRRSSETTWDRSFTNYDRAMTRIVDLTEGLMKPREAKSHRNKMEAERNTMLNAYSRKVFVPPVA
ncbi:BQ5605_C134g13387 [Microbotryum silenes-dioicae]|uniref:BQ5605_C134g13387 protein n=1 Tax=Microbotryum silenes-dioicae TaxID=796604 RepID=A0A2X0MIW4_9BASI|nr:BQ5605_C134g13387 [Microbotryum silenes-dioicae]